MAEEKKHKYAGHGYKHTHIEHHDDGSHTIHHEHEDGKHERYAVGNLDEFHDGLQDHLGVPNPGEAEAEAGPVGAAAQQRLKEPHPEQSQRGPKMAEKHNVSLYRAMHHLRKGGLHRALGIPEHETIPADKLEAARNSKNEHVRKMAELGTAHQRN